uniref:Histone deacetylase domain-containing protein n=1 Tax=Esox lucius TaxID=8010 RepID=A0A6Q2WWC9_ESOLU
MTSGTALIFDEEMTRYKLLWVDPACKIEVPERLTVCCTALQEEGLAQRCVSVPVRQATDSEILLVHSEEYLEGVKKTPYMNLEELQTFTQQYGDVYFHPNIYHCAKMAVGSTLQLVDSVMGGKVRNGMALVRPPGHHSQRSAANGFCVFNNVAIAAQYAKKHYGVKSVLYFSWHRYEHQEFWPNLRESDYDNVGKEKGAGFNINVPWNKVGMENSDYLSVFFHVLLPIAYEFSPDLVLVCAGFDSAIGDPEGHMCATPDIFAHLTRLLMSLAGGKLCAVLEGGYNLTSLAQSVCQTVQTLLGDPTPPTSELNGPCERFGSALESIQCVRSAHKPFWACLQHTGTTQRPHPPLSCHSHHSICNSLRSCNGTMGFMALHRLPLSRPAGIPWSPTRFPTTVFLTFLLKEITGGKDQQSGARGTDIRKPCVRGSKKGTAYCLETKNRVLPEDCLLWRKCRLFEMFDIVCTSCECVKSPYPWQGCSDTAGLMQIVLGLLLPLAYEYDPGLVVLARGPGTELGEAAWQQVIGLLQGLAQGHTLALLQVRWEAVGATAASLLGDPAPSLGPLGAPCLEDMEAMERLRQRLQTHWGLLKTSGEQMVSPSKGSR